MDNVKAKVRIFCRALYASIVKGSPPEPCEEVQALFESLHVPKRQQLMMYHVFHELRQGEVEETVKTAVEINRESVYELILERRRWVEELLNCLLMLGGCEEETVSWDEFLYILLQFCSLSKVELCQALFLIIQKRLESKVLHYLTMGQLIDFYNFYAKCSVTSFNSRGIDFTRLPLRRYYVEDFAELVQRFTVLLNPTIHLQRSLQEFLPSVEFWDNYHRSEVVIRKITHEFFKMEKTRCFLWGEPPFRETCEMLAPEALGFEACNRDQWNLRTFDLHERIGAVSDKGSFSRDGKFMAPPGFSYRPLKQLSIWGEQPSPEETEQMMMQSGEDIYLNEAGYVTKHIGVYDKAEEMFENQDPNEKKEKAKRQKQAKQDAKKASLAHDEEELDPLNDPTSACLRGACLDETFNPPPVDMPPPWMKRAAIAPAPRILKPDPPLWRQVPPGASTQSSFRQTNTSYGGHGRTSLQFSGQTLGASATSFGKSQTAMNRGGFGLSPGASKRGKMDVTFSDV